MVGSLTVDDCLLLPSTFTLGGNPVCAIRGSGPMCIARSFSFIIGDGGVCDMRSLFLHSAFAAASLACVCSGVSASICVKCGL